MKSAKYPLWLILTATIVHGVLLFGAHQQTGRVDGYAFNSLDAKEYYQIACNLVDHGVFSQSESTPFKPDTWRTPGYPMFLAMFMLVLGKSTAMLIVVQQILCILNVWLFYRIALSSLSERRSLIAALLFLIEPYHLYYTLWLLATTLFVTLILVTWHLWIRLQKSPCWWKYILSGLLCGLLILVRPISIFIPIIFFIGLLLTVIHQYRKTKTVRHAGLEPIIFMAVCMVVVSSWMIRNKNQTGYFALSDQSGVVLSYFKATEVVLWREGKSQDRYIQTSLDPAKQDQPHFVWESIDEKLRQQLIDVEGLPLDQIHWTNLAQGNKTTINSFVISDALQKIGWSYIFESPLSSLACGLTRCGSLLTFPFNMAVRPPNGIEVNRLRSAILGGFYLLLTLVVLLKLYRTRWSLVDVYFPAACTAALLLMTTPQMDPRFRVPMIPFLIILALMSNRHRKTE